MKIGIACGGTGGHVFPGLATADVLGRRGHEVELWVSGKDVESAALATWQGRKVCVPAEGFAHGARWQALRAAWRLWQASRACRRIMQAAPPRVVLAMGSYASVGPVAAALRLKVPVVLHEANVIPGRAIALLSRWATAVGISFEETSFYLKRREVVLTGMPLRRDLIRRDGIKCLPELNRGLFTLLVMGGSRGARSLNEIATAAVCLARRMGNSLQVIHLAGVDDEPRVRAAYAQAGMPHVVQAFVQDMASLYAAADLAICRSGAATCAELVNFEVPALFVPYPHATHNHQMMNARAMEKKGVADVIPEKDLSPEWLAEYITGCMATPERVARMSAAAKKMSGRDAAETLADLVEQSAGPAAEPPAPPAAAAAP